MVTLITPKRLVSIWARKSARLRVLDRADVPIARVVHQHVQPSEGRDRGRDRLGGGALVRHVEGDGADLIAIALHQVGELRRVPRRGDEAVPGGQHRLGERAAEAPGAAGDQPDLGHHNLLEPIRSVGIAPA